MQSVLFTQRGKIDEENRGSPAALWGGVEKPERFVELLLGTTTWNDLARLPVPLPHSVPWSDFAAGLVGANVSDSFSSLNGGLVV